MSSVLDKSEPRKLVHCAKPHGRWCQVTTYYDGATPIIAELLFKTAEDSRRFAELVVTLEAP